MDDGFLLARLDVSFGPMACVGAVTHRLWSGNGSRRMLKIGFGDIDANDKAQITVALTYESSHRVS
jgi:hypothetical protein